MISRTHKISVQRIYLILMNDISMSELVIPQTYKVSAKEDRGGRADPEKLEFSLQTLEFTILFPIFRFCQLFPVLEKA